MRLACALRSILVLLVRRFDRLGYQFRLTIRPPFVFFLRMLVARWCACFSAAFLSLPIARCLADSGRYCQFGRVLYRVDMDPRPREILRWFGVRRLFEFRVRRSCDKPHSLDRRSVRAFVATLGILWFDCVRAWSSVPRQLRRGDSRTIVGLCEAPARALLRFLRNRNDRARTDGVPRCERTGWRRGVRSVGPLDLAVAA